jgi:hypothetical protein
MKGEPVTQGQQQGGQQQQPSPVQKMGRALTDIRKVQNMLELSSPGQTDAIKMLRQAGDLVWEEIERLQQQQGS